MNRPALKVQRAETIVTNLRSEYQVWKSIVRQNAADFVMSTEPVSKAEYERKLADLHARMGGARQWNIIQNVIKDTALFSLWENHREVYDIHPAVTRALSRTAMNTQVPGQLFSQLRHVNPMFVFPDGLEVVAADGLPGLVRAMLLTGARRGPLNDPGVAVLDTSDPHCNGVRAIMYTDLLSQDGQEVVDMDVATFMIPFDRDQTLQQLVDVTVERDFVWDRTQAEPAQDRQRAYLSRLMTVAVEHLTYAVSQSFDMEDRTRAEVPPAARRASTGKPKKQKAALIRRVGFRDGAAIEATYRRREEYRAAGLGTGRTMAPHMRSAHWHTYLTGPGRTTPVVKWLPPTLVNAHRDDGETVTLHPVRSR